MAGRVTQATVDVVLQQQSRARVTQSFDEVVFNQESRARITALMVEIIRSVAGTTATFDEGVFKDVRPAYDWENHYNKVLVEYVGRAVGPKSVIYQAREPIVLHPGESRTVTVKLDQPVISVDSPVHGTDYFARTAGGLDTSASLDLSMSACAQKVDLTFANTGSVFTTFITGLQLVGVPVVGQFSSTVAASSASSIAQFGTLAVEFPPNPLVQDRVVAGFIAEYLTDRLEAPRRVIEVQDIPGSATAMPGIKTTYSELTRTQVSGSGYIAETSWRLDKGFSVDLKIVTSDIFRFTDYHKLDEDTWGEGRLWY